MPKVTSCRRSPGPCLGLSESSLCLNSGAGLSGALSWPRGKSGLVQALCAVPSTQAQGGGGVPRVLASRDSQEPTPCSDLTWPPAALGSHSPWEPRRPGSVCVGVCFSAEKTEPPGQPRLRFPPQAQPLPSHPRRKHSRATGPPNRVAAPWRGAAAASWGGVDPVSTCVTLGRSLSFSSLGEFSFHEHFK